MESNSCFCRCIYVSCFRGGMFAVSGRCQDGYREQGAERRADFAENIFSTKKTPKRRLNIPTNLVNSRRIPKIPTKNPENISRFFSRIYFWNSPILHKLVGGVLFSQAICKHETLAKAPQSYYQKWGGKEKDLVGCFIWLTSWCFEIFFNFHP